MMKTFLYCILACQLLLCGCHESLEKRAQREAQEYTEKYCPTPVQNYVRTDSVVFDIPTRTYHYYCSVMNELDDDATFALNEAKIAESLASGLNENTNVRSYKNAGFSFAWTLRSGKDAKKVYLTKTLSPKDYNAQ